MRRILIIAYYFPPVAASGAMRPLAFTRYLGLYGWKPRVLSAHHDSVYPVHPVDSQLLDKLPGAVRVDAVHHGNPLQRIISIRNKLFGVNSESRSGDIPGPVLAAAAPSSLSGPGTLSTVKEYLLDRMFAFPDPQCAWLKPALKFAKSMPSSEVPDVVFATGGPWTSLVIGRQLAQFWKLPFVADYRDPWISNPYVTFGSERLNERARQLEKGVCEAAARVITNTYELRERLVKDYPAIEKKSLTITNGFDPDSFSIGAGKSNRPHAANNRLEICHFGTVYGKRTPEVLLGVLLELHRAGQVDGRKLCFRFVGAWEVTGRECEDLAQSLEKVGLLERCPPVSYHACLQQMSQADALLVIQPGSPLQIPGKIYEYVATRRPILLIGGEGATANLVQRHRFGLTTSNHVDHVRRLILDLVEGRQSLSVPGFEEVERFNYQTLTGQLAKVLDEVYQEKARKFD